MSMCRCGHARHRHVTGGWPHYRTSCDVCLHCGGSRPLGKDCCLTPKPCLCQSFEAVAA